MTEQHATEPSISDHAHGVVITQRIGAPPEAVFPYLVEPERMLRWMGTAVRLEPAPGGEFWLDMNGTDIAIGTFTEIDPPNRVVFTWGWEGSAEVPPGSTTVSINLTVDGTDTILELRHDGLPDDLRARHHEGWNHFLPQLVEQLATPEQSG